MLFSQRIENSKESLIGMDGDGLISLRSWRYCVVVEWDLAAEPL